MMKTARIVSFVVFFAAIVGHSATQDAVEEIIDPDDEFMNLNEDSVPAIPEISDWKNWEGWVPPKKIVKMAPVYKLGYDNEGLPVFVLEYGKWDYRALAQLTEDELKGFDKFLDWKLRHIGKDAVANEHHAAAIVADFDEFELRHYASRKAFKLALKSFTALASLGQFMKYGYQINTNFAVETFMNDTRPFLGDLFDRFEVYGTKSEKWKPVLLSKISPNQLPPKYGGTRRWEPIAVA